MVLLRQCAGCALGKGGSYASSWSLSSSSWFREGSPEADASSDAPVAYRLSVLMLCRNPYTRDGIAHHGCGQCLPCRVNRRRLWTWRMYLESLTHTTSAFITLTYDQENLPADNSLVPAHSRNFLKRLRKRLEPQRVRFFLSREYGDVSGRPHYHAIVFGLSALQYKIVEASWGLGFVSVAEFNEQRAAYTCGYVVKKLGEKALNGRHPEFSRSSNRPGIGAPALAVIEASLRAASHTDHSPERSQETPHALTIGGRSVPLGRYLRNKLREVFLNEDQISENKAAYVMEQYEKLRALFPHSFDDRGYYLGNSTRRLVEASAGGAAALEGRVKVQMSRRRL